MLLESTWSLPGVLLLRSTMLDHPLFHHFQGYIGTSGATGNVEYRKGDKNGAEIWFKALLQLRDDPKLLAFLSTSALRNTTSSPP